MDREGRMYCKWVEKEQITGLIPLKNKVYRLRAKPVGSGHSIEESDVTFSVTTSHV